jgi:vacuolar-type H+-ATPase subunit H
MATKSLITISERLDEFLSEAETETRKIVSEAQVQAAKCVAETKAEADKMRLQVERGEALRKAIQEEEDKAAQIAKETMKNYSGKIEAMESAHRRNKHKAVELVTKAVLPS